MIPEIEKPKRIDKFDALKQWLKLWQLYPAVLIVVAATAWCVNVQAAQTEIVKEQAELKEDAKSIKEDLRWRHQKDDERWENILNKVSEIHEMLSDGGRQ